MLGNGSFLNSPWNTQVDDMRPPVSRQRRYCFTWNNYPLDAEEQLRPLAERKRIVVPREAVYVVVVRRRRRYVTRRRRYAILFYFRKLNLHYVLQQNSKMILQVIENLKIAHCTLCMCYTHCTFVMCNPKHCTGTQLLWVILGSCAPPTVAEAKPVSVGRSRWSLLLLAFARQQRVFRKTSSRSSACWGTGHF